MQLQKNTRLEATGAACIPASRKRKTKSSRSQNFQQAANKLKDAFLATRCSTRFAASRLYGGARVRRVVERLSILCKRALRIFSLILKSKVAYVLSLANLAALNLKYKMPNVLISIQTSNSARRLILGGNNKIGTQTYKHNKCTLERAHSTQPTLKSAQRDVRDGGRRSGC